MKLQTFPVVFTDDLLGGVVYQMHNNTQVKRIDCEAYNVFLMKYILLCTIDLVRYSFISHPSEGLSVLICHYFPLLNAALL